MSNQDLGKVCQHGQLARQCEMCDLILGIEEARAMINETKKLLETALRLENERDEALGALADIAYSGDMTLSLAQKKAKRIYDAIRKRSEQRK